jgi:hypothetical protein
MKLKASVLIGMGIGLAGVSLIAGAVRHGSSILHFTVTTEMTNTGVASNAVGSVKLSQNQQGNANNQRLDLAVRALSPDTGYLLLALVGDASNYVEAAQFTTDANGSAKLNYKKVGSSQGKNNGNGNGKGKSPLPAALDPLSNVRELAVSDASTNPVVLLTADITAPDKLQYLVKRNLTNDGAETNAVGSIEIKATTQSTKFRLLGAGLSASSEYVLVLNGTISQTNTTDASGNLKITSWLVAPSDVLDVHSLALWNNASNSVSVLSTQLP